MLYEFLGQHKMDIIQLCKDKVIADGQSKPTSTLLEEGLPIFYDELIGVLRRTADASDAKGRTQAFIIENKIKEGDAAAHGKESLRLGYTLSQIVHSYGAVCQAVMEYVQSKSYKITSREFQDLNLSLDCAIAEAVTEFEKWKNENTANTEVQRLGYLMHELKNALTAAIASHEMIQLGSVGTKGVTSEVLSRSHERMQRLIESAEVEIRFQGHAVVERTLSRLIDITREVRTAATIIQTAGNIQLKFEIDPEIQLMVDRHLLFSALLNLVTNAVKFTKAGGTVSVRSHGSGGRVLIEVEDECGGLPDGTSEELFKLFVQKGTDKTGMGLGLSLSRRAIELNQGTLTARNIPGKGCVFTIDLPIGNSPMPPPR